MSAGGVILASGSLTTVGSVSLAGSSTTLPVLDVFANSATYSGNLMYPRLAAGWTGTCNTVTCQEGTTELFNVDATGQITLPNGLSVAGDGATIGGALSADTLLQVASGNVVVSGSLSIASSTMSALDVLANHATLTANALLGRVPAGEINGNSFLLTKDTTLLFQVRSNGWTGLPTDGMAVNAGVTVTGAGLAVTSGGATVADNGFFVSALAFESPAACEFEG